MQRPLRTLRSRIVPELFESRTAVVVLCLVVVVLTAGCAGLGGDDTSSKSTDTTSAAIDSVPSNVDVVVQVDVQANDEAGAALAEELNNATVAGDDGSAHAERWQGLLTTENASAPEAIERVTGFARLPERPRPGNGTDAYLGLIVDADASWEEIVRQGDGVETEERTHEGVPVSVLDADGEQTWIAEFENGTFAVGTEAAVTDVIDTRAGDAEPFGGDLRAAFENADTGGVKLAVAVPETLADSAADENESAGIAANLDLPELEAVTVVLDSEGTNLSLATQVTTDSEAGAEDLASLAALATNVGAGVDDERTAEFLTDLEVAQDGRHVSLSTTLAPAEVTELLAQLREAVPEGDIDAAAGAAVNET